MTDIVLDTEVPQIRRFIATRNYPGGYAYISSIIAQHPEFDQTTAFWFEKARMINMNIRSDPADIYIRAATACGLRWDSKLADDRAANAKMLQATSDSIGEAVLTGIANDRAITNVNTFLNQDIVGALASGQTIGGWGGAFYYWNAPFIPPGTTQIMTVGDYIRTHPDELEKFISCNAVASHDALWETALPGLEASATIPGRADAIALARANLLFQGLAVNRQAQAPDWVKAAIRSRVVEMTLGKAAAGSPDEIADFRYRNGRWFEPALETISVDDGEGSITVSGLAQVKDPHVTEQLDARRAIRLQHRAFQPTPAY